MVEKNASEEMKNKFDEFSLKIREIKKELSELKPKLTMPDQLAVHQLAIELSWAIEKCTIIGLHQIGRELSNKLGVSEVTIQDGTF